MSHLTFTDYKGFGEKTRKETHISQAVRVGDIIEVAGQGGWDRITEEISEDLGKEIDQTFNNVEHALQQSGGKGWSQVYKVRCYCVPLTEEAIGHLVRNLKKYCPDHEPVLTGIGVQGLAFPGMHIEIEVSAHVGSN